MSSQIFCFKPGFGKTPLACAKVKSLFEKEEYKNGAALFVVPESLIGQWKDWIEETGLVLGKILVGKKGERKEFIKDAGLLPQRVYLTTPGTLVEDVKAGVYDGGKPSIIVYDEVHSLSSFCGDVSDRFKYLSEFNVGISVKVGLTATPCQNSPMDFFTAYAFFEEPGWIANGRLYKSYDSNLWNTDKNFMHVKDVLVEGKMFFFGATGQQKNFNLKETLVPVKLCEKIAEGTRILSENNVDEQKIAQYILCPKSFEGDETFRNLGVDTDSVSSKMLFAQRMIKEAPPDERFIIFSNYKDVLKKMESELVQSGTPQEEVVVYTGADYEKKIEGFKDSKKGKARILLATLEKAGTGLNLQSANHMIILDFWWSPSRLEQAMHRIIRYGQERDVSLYFPFYMEYEDGHILPNIVDKKHFDTVMDKVEELRNFIGKIAEEKRCRFSVNDESADEMEKHAVYDFPFEAFPGILDMERLCGLHKEDDSNWLTEALSSRESLPSNNKFLFYGRDEVMVSESGVDSFKSICAAAGESSKAGCHNDKVSKLRSRYEARAENDCQCECAKALSGNNASESFWTFLEKNGIFKWLDELNGSMDSIGSIRKLLKKDEEEVICGYCNLDKDELEFETRDWLNRYVACCNDNVNVKKRSGISVNYADICDWIFRELSGQRKQLKADAVRFRYDAVFDRWQSVPLFKACIVLFEAKGLEQRLKESETATGTADSQLQKAGRMQAFYRAAFDWFLGIVQDADGQNIEEVLKQVHIDSCRMLGYLDAMKKSRLGSEEGKGEKSVIWENMTSGQQAMFISMTVEQRRAFLFLKPEQQMRILSISDENKNIFISMPPEWKTSFMTMKAFFNNDEKPSEG